MFLTRFYSPITLSLVILRLHIRLLIPHLTLPPTSPGKLSLTDTSLQIPKPCEFNSIHTYFHTISLNSSKRWHFPAQGKLFHLFLIPLPPSRILCQYIFCVPCVIKLSLSDSLPFITKLYVYLFSLIIKLPNF